MLKNKTIRETKKRKDGEWRRKKFVKKVSEERKRQQDQHTCHLVVEERVVEESCRRESWRRESWRML